MIKRIIEVGNAAHLALKNNQLVVRRNGFEPETIPVEDLGVLILDHPAISYTQALLTACSDNNVAVLICNEKHLPNAICLPLTGNSLHTKILNRQIQIAEPVRKRLWQEIIRAKILGQAKVLDKVINEDHLLNIYAEKVKSGDSENMEAQASRIYWPKLFGGNFRRNPDESGINTLLNYGYSIIRAAVARAIVGAGLHPSLGIHHHNQYNNFCLADDLMEPIRPAVDIKVFELLKLSSDELKLTSGNKLIILHILNNSCCIGGTNLPLMSSLHYYSASIKRVLCGEDKKPEIPSI
jgi:CRISPR-associated protein Cas1